MAKIELRLTRLKVIKVLPSTCPKFHLGHALFKSLLFGSILIYLFIFIFGGTRV
jgi:hypothetical protein